MGFITGGDFERDLGKELRARHGVGPLRCLQGFHSGRDLVKGMEEEAE